MRALATLIGIVACIVLTSCGSLATAGTSPTYPATCPISSATPDASLMPTTLQVVRLHNVAMAPFSRCVSNAPSVQALYTAALAQQRTSGLGGCPKGAGIEYDLTFLHGSSIVQKMTLQADGCRFLYISQTDIRVTYEDFQIQVADILDLTQLSPSLPLTGSGTT